MMHSKLARKWSSWWGLGLFLSLTFLVSCGSDEIDAPDVSHIDVDIKVHRLEQDLVGLDTKEKAAKWLDEHPQLAQQFFRRGEYPAGVLEGLIAQFAAHAASDTLLMDANRVFGDFQVQKEAFEQAFRYLKYYYPEEKIPNIYTIVSGFGAFCESPDLFFGPDYIVLGLDFFAGKNSTYRPDIPGYMLERYEPESIVPFVMKQLSGKHIKSAFVDQTLLADMVYYGKACFFTKKMLPAVHDSLIIGYSGQNLANIYRNQKEIYTHFVEKNLFFETNPTVKKKYVGERPTVPEIADICPGRVGRWLGWQFVARYTYHHPDKTFQEVLEIEEAQEIFQKSRYQPEDMDI